MAIDWPATAAGMSAIAAIASVAAVALAPMVAERLGAKLQSSAAAYERKLDCLRRVAAYRSQRPSPEWMAALNEIAITFNDNEAVMTALIAFQKNVVSKGGHDNNDLARLIETMMDALGLNRVKIDRKFLLSPFQMGVGNVLPA